jgi:MATE family multidrug resistance protein
MHANQCNTWKLKFHGPTFPQLGMASALETLCGQSYGAKQYHMLGIYLQRSWIMLFACAAALLPVYLFTDRAPPRRALGQDPRISAVAGVISLWYIPVMLAYVCGPSPSRCTSRRGART